MCVSAADVRGEEGEAGAGGAARPDEAAAGERAEGAAQAGRGRRAAQDQEVRGPDRGAAAEPGRAETGRETGGTG